MRAIRCRGPGQTYAVEITRKNSFEWGYFDSVHSKLYFAGSSTMLAAKNVSKFKALEELKEGDAVLTVDRVNMEREG